MFETGCAACSCECQDCACTSGECVDCGCELWDRELVH